MPTALPPKLGAVHARLLGMAETSTEGTLLPSERELAERWHVARMTIRRAMDDLVESGHLERRHGVGTFVRRPRLERPLTATSFSDEITRRGSVPRSEVMEYRETVAPTAVALHLGIPVGDPVIEFVRLRYADDLPIAIEHTKVAAALVPGLRPTDLTGSWYRLLARRYGIHVAGGTTRLRPALPTAAQARALRISQRDPCQVARVTVRDRTGRPIDTCETAYRGDRYVVTAELGSAATPPTGVDQHRGEGPSGLLDLAHAG